MKRKLLVLSVLAFGLSSGAALAELTAQGEIVASSFPADAEASYTLPALESHAEYYARVGEPPESWGVSRREVEPHDPFPFGGGPVDD